jgi:hypothetical protein
MGGKKILGGWTNGRAATAHSQRPCLGGCGRGRPLPHGGTGVLPENIFISSDACIGAFWRAELTLVISTHI